jgi:hypothetical protein
MEGESDPGVGIFSMDDRSADPAPGAGFWIYSGPLASGPPPSAAFQSRPSGTPAQGPRCDRRRREGRGNSAPPFTNTGAAMEITKREKGNYPVAQMADTDYIKMRNFDLS